MVELLKAFWAIVPFLTEMIFPGKTTKEVIHQNKYSFFVTILLFFSLSFNWIMLKRVYAIAMEEKYQRIANPRNNNTAAAASNAYGSASAASGAAMSQDDIDKKARDDIRDRLNNLFGVTHP